MNELGMLFIFIAIIGICFAFLCVALHMFLSAINYKNYDKYEGLMQIALGAFGLGAVFGIVGFILMAIVK